MPLNGGHFSVQAQAHGGVVRFEHLGEAIFEQKRVSHLDRHDDMGRTLQSLACGGQNQSQLVKELLGLAQNILGQGTELVNKNTQFVA